VNTTKNLFFSKTQRPPRVPRITLCYTTVGDHADVKTFSGLCLNSKQNPKKVTRSSLHVNQYILMNIIYEWNVIGMAVILSYRIWLYLYWMRCDAHSCERVKITNFVRPWSLPKLISMIRLGCDNWIWSKAFLHQKWFLYAGHYIWCKSQRLWFAASIQELKFLRGLPLNISLFPVLVQIVVRVPFVCC